MSMEISPELAEKRDQLLKQLASWGRVAVAFSAGVDSTVVAKAAMLACGDKAVAVTAASPSLASGELEQAAELAAQIGIRHIVLKTDEFSEPGYIANAGNRCYFCKSELYTRILERLDELQVDVICNGANLDDLGDHRPGMQAARERDVRSPLVEARLNKAEVRELARTWGLPIWDKPAAPCLSSRIAYGQEVTEERVQRVDAAEQFLRQCLGERELRVRLEANELARIEVPLSALGKLTSEPIRTEVAQELRELGFRFITLDLEGFRSGSMNASLPVVQLQVMGADES